jgi:S1-C subfamily serine protease
MRRALLVLAAALAACKGGDPRAASPSAAKAAKTDDTSASGPWIARINSYRYIVDRARVMAFLDGKSPVPGLEADAAGKLIVRDAAPDSEWARAGLHARDAIVELNGLPVHSIDDARAIVRRLDGARALIVGVQSHGHVELYEYRFGDPVKDAPFTDPSLRTIADLVKKYWIKKLDDGHYEVDAIVPAILFSCVGGQLHGPDSSGFSKLPVIPDAASCEAIGARVDDKLVSLDGKPIAGADDLYSALTTPSERGRIAIELERSGTRVNLEYVVRPGTYAHPGEPVLSHPEVLMSLVLAAPHPPSVSAPNEAAIAGGIRRFDEGHVEIQRALYDRWMSDSNALLATARFVPSIREGRPNGFKLYAIRPAEAIGALGFQNGDTLLAVNGKPVTTPDLALDVWTELRRARRFIVEGERRGQPFSIEIVVVAKK